MKRYAFIADSIVTEIIEGKDDETRNWEEYYAETRGILCVALPEDLPVGVGFTYENGEFTNPNTPATTEELLTSWRQNTVVDLYKIKIVLDQMGNLEDIEAIIALQPKAVQIAWEYTAVVRRISPTVSALAQIKGYTPEQLDTIFSQADAIEL